MTGEKFDRIVKARADQRVNEKIKQFKSVCSTAYAKLTGENWYTNFPDSVMAELIFGILASKKHCKGWPKELWEKEEKEVESELLSIMDEMQKALLAAELLEEGENTQMV